MGGESGRHHTGSEQVGRRIPEATAVRLPVYQRIVAECVDDGMGTVSSVTLAERARVSAATVRKDLSLLGSFGTRGTGYDTAFLVAQIDRALGADREWPVAVVGIGNLGRALVGSEGFGSRGFRITSLFDVDPAVVGKRFGSVVVRHSDGLVDLGKRGKRPRPAIGVIATPGSAAQGVCDALVAIGVPSILSFAPVVLTVPPSVHLRSVDLSIELQVLSFFQSRTT